MFPARGSLANRRNSRSRPDQFLLIRKPGGQPAGNPLYDETKPIPDCHVSPASPNEANSGSPCQFRITERSFGQFGDGRRISAPESH
jgi:hypothetical protein